jgi:ATP-dependent DNA helicase RecG
MGGEELPQKDSYEKLRSEEMKLTFDSAKEEFAKQKVQFGVFQMATLKLIDADKMYTNLALLLSDQCIHTTKVALFEDSTSMVIKDRQEFGGSLFKQFSDVHYLLESIGKSITTTDERPSSDSRDYPEIALREALLNMILHREYAVSESNLIKIFSDRIEFISPGGLVDGISSEDIASGYSAFRNPYLAEVLQRLHYAEAHGTGISKMLEAYKTFYAKPKTEVTANVFKMILPNANVMAYARKELAPEEKIMQFVRENGYISRKQAEAVLGVSQTAAGVVLRNLTEKGELKRQGHSRNIKYVL